MRKFKLGIILFLFFLFFSANPGWTEESAEEWFERGIKNIETENYKEAVYSFKKTIDLHPNHIPSYNNLGYLYNIMGKWDEAIETYKKALAVNPNDVRTNHDLGFSLYKKGALDEAIAQCKKAIALDSEFAPPYYISGVIYLEKKMFKEAVPVFKKALEITPDYPAAHRNLGQAYKELGKNISGADHYYQAGILYLKENNREEALIVYENILDCSKEIAGVFLKKLYPDEEAPTPTTLLPLKKKNQWHTLIAKMNIRKDHSTDSKIIGQLDKDTKFEIIREAPNNTPLYSWYLIRTKSGFSGWLCGVHKGIIKYEIVAERNASSFSIP